jgi:hypothetical protein
MLPFVYRNAWLFEVVAVLGFWSAYPTTWPTLLRAVAALFALSLPSECVLLNGLVFRDIHSSPS